MFLCLCETWWDDYFNAINFDWKITKQNDEKYSLQFMDYDESYLCTFFGLAVTFLPMDCAVKAMAAKYLTFGFRTYTPSQKTRGQGIEKVHPDDSEDQARGERVKFNHIKVKSEGINELKLYNYEFTRL